MIKVKRIDHVAIAVGDCDASARTLSEVFGLTAGAREFVAAQQTEVAFLHPDDVSAPMIEPHSPGTGAALEIIAPTAGNPGLQRFLDRRGPGLHHICFEVDDLEGTLATLKTAGIRLIDETPRPGARGHMVAFIHPASTGGVLFELCASPHGA